MLFFPSADGRVPSRQGWVQNASGWRPRHNLWVFGERARRMGALVRKGRCCPLSLVYEGLIKQAQDKNVSLFSLSLGSLHSSSGNKIGTPSKRRDRHLKWLHHERDDSAPYYNLLNSFNFLDFAIFTSRIEKSLKADAMIWWPRTSSSDLSSLMLKNVTDMLLAHFQS